MLVPSCVATLLLTAAAGFSVSPLSTATRRVQIVQPLQMANNPGALKRIKTNERNRLRNREWRAKVRTWTRKTKEAVDAGDVDAAKECARMATSAIVRAILVGPL